MTVSDMSFPGMKPEMAQAMKAAMGKATKIVSCLTPEEAKKPDFFGKDNDCRYDRFVMSGGTIDAVAHCAENGKSRAMTIKGAYSADSYRVETEMSSDGPEAMHMKMAMDAKRTGECQGTEDKE